MRDVAKVKYSLENSFSKLFSVEARAPIDADRVRDAQQSLRLQKLVPEAPPASRSQTLIDNLPDVVCSIDATGTFTAVSKASFHEWGFGPNELIGVSLDKLVVEEDAHQIYNTLTTIRERKSNRSIEVRIRRKDGAIVFTEWSVRWSATNAQYYCVVQDISQRKKVEALKEEFVSMVSHDLRAPLLSVQAFLNILSEGIYGDISSKGLAAAGKLQGCLVRLLRLINDLLDLSKMEADKMHMRFDPVGVNDVIGDAVDALKGYAEAQKVSFNVSCSSMAQVRGDKDRLVQVVANLLSNAIKFSPQNTAVALNCFDEKDAIAVEIIDQGPGVPENYKDAIFDKFTQINQGDGDHQTGGSGLGLAICKAIVEEHQGSIGVKSRGTVGSSFWIRLPRMTA